jgi:hypothetical protein
MKRTAGPPLILRVRRQEAQSQSHVVATPKVVADYRKSSPLNCDANAERVCGASTSTGGLRPCNGNWLGRVEGT